MSISTRAAWALALALSLAAGQANGQGHAHRHTGHAADSSIDTAAVREYKAAHARMMRNMKLPFTGDPDIDFRTHMIPHHQGAMDMARVALRYANDSWTRQEAQVILIAQQQEIAQFQSELARRGAKVPPGGQPRYIITANTYTDTEELSKEAGTPDELVGKTWAPGSGVPLQSGGAPHPSATSEFKAAHAKMMRNMSKPFTGDPDVDFRTHMIPHHQGAIDMAGVAMRHARNGWTRQAADAIITAQKKEIYKFQIWLANRGAMASSEREPR